MHPGAVIALVVVLGQHLPVRSHLVVDPAGADQPVQRVAPGAIEHRSELGCQVGLVLRVQVDEGEAAPGLDPDRVQPELAGVEAGDRVGVRRPAQGAVQGVGPRVVRAAQRAGRARGRWLPRLVRHQLGAAMPADVGQRVQPAGPVPGQQHALAGHLDHGQPLGIVRVCSGQAQGVEPADADPAAGQHLLLLDPVRRRVDVVPAWQRRLQPVRPARLVGWLGRLGHRRFSRCASPAGSRSVSRLRRCARRRSASTCRTTLRPGMPVTPPPPWVADPAW